MISNLSKKENQDAFENHFSTIIDHLNRIDIEMSNLTNNYNDGQGSLAFLRFENSDISESISTKGFTYGPAYTTIKQINGKYCLVKNVKNPLFILEDQQIKEALELEKEIENQDFQAESLEDFQKRVKNNQETAEKESIKEVDEKSLNTEDEEIFNRFGNLNKPIRLIAARNSFNKALDNIINIANELHILKTKYSLQNIHL